MSDEDFPHTVSLSTTIMNKRKSYLCEKYSVPGVNFTNPLAQSINALVPGVNFTNVLRTAFILVGPKRAK